MSTKIRIIWACICYAALAFPLIYNKEWIALIWCLLALVMCILLILEGDKVVKLTQRNKKNKMINANLNKMLTMAMGKNEALLANCKRYQDELKRLRAYENDTNRRRIETGTEENN